MKHRNIHIYGRVQGVSYRWAARTMARYLGIKGFVKNMADGSVYIEAEGEENQLKEFIKWCHKGPDHALVDKIDVFDKEVVNYDTFDIRF